MVDAHPTDRPWEWCQSRHVGAVISGRMHVVTDDGEEFDVGPYDVIDVAPGHDATHAGRTDSARYAKVRRDAHSEGRRL